jgi:hypothetical protein
MGFKDVRTLLVDALQSGRFQHEHRADVSRNLLAVGEVSPEFVAQLLLRCTGRDYSCTPHHFDERVACHVFKPAHEGHRWYVKAYFLSADAMFISVHR